MKETNKTYNKKETTIVVIVVSVVMSILLILRIRNEILYNDVYKLLRDISLSEFEVQYEDSDGCKSINRGYTFIDGDNNFRITIDSKESNDEYIDKYVDEKASAQKYREAECIMPSVINKEITTKPMIIKTSYGYDTHETFNYEDGEVITVKHQLILDKSGTKIVEIKGEHFTNRSFFDKSKWKKHYITSLVVNSTTSK